MATVWKNDKFTLTENRFRQIIYLVIFLVKPLLSRNFCQKRVIFHNYHCCVWGKRENHCHSFFRQINLTEIDDKTVAVKFFIKLLQLYVLPVLPKKNSSILLHICYLTFPSVRADSLIRLFDSTVFCWELVFRKCFYLLYFFIKFNLLYLIFELCSFCSVYEDRNFYFHQILATFLLW